MGFIPGLNGAKYVHRKYFIGPPCPHHLCDAIQSKRIDSRRTADGSSLIRRRECTNGHRFTTTESVRVVNEKRELVVIKRDGSYELFELDKLRRSIELACLHLHGITSDRINRIARSIEWHVGPENGLDTKNNRAPSQVLVKYDMLGQLVMESLRELNQIAFIRYALVHLRLSDVSELMNLINP